MVSKFVFKLSFAQLSNSPAEPHKSMFVNNTRDTRMKRIGDLIYIFLCLNSVMPVNGLNALYQVMVIKF